MKRHIHQHEGDKFPFPNKAAPAYFRAFQNEHQFRLFHLLQTKGAQRQADMMAALNHKVNGFVVRAIQHFGPLLSPCKMKSATIQYQLVEQQVLEAMRYYRKLASAFTSIESGDTLPVSVQDLHQTDFKNIAIFNNLMRLRVAFLCRNSSPAKPVSVSDINSVIENTCSAKYIFKYLIQSGLAGQHPTDGRGYQNSKVYWIERNTHSARFCSVLNYIADVLDPKKKGCYISAFAEFRHVKTFYTKPKADLCNQ